MLQIKLEGARSRATIETHFLSYNGPDLEDTIVVRGLKYTSVTQRGLKDILRGTTQPGTVIADQLHKVTHVRI